MDVFYYWKDYAADVKSGRIGRFRVSKDRLTELQEGFPSYIWAFKTPEGKKGQVQLLARMMWSDTPSVALATTPGDSYVYYDPDNAQSVCFMDSSSDEAVHAVSDWVGRHFPKSIASNFQGANGQLAMRNIPVRELQSISKGFTTLPLLEGLAQPRERALPVIP